MAQVVRQENENFESMLRRFNRKVTAGGIMKELRQREAFEPNSVKRKRKAAAAKKRATSTRTPSYELNEERERSE